MNKDNNAAQRMTCCAWFYSLDFTVCGIQCFVFVCHFVFSAAPVINTPTIAFLSNKWDFKEIRSTINTNLHQVLNE